MSGWTWTWRISPDQLRALICAGAYSHTQHGLQLRVHIDASGGIDVEVNVVPEPPGLEEGPR